MITIDPDRKIRGGSYEIAGKKGEFPTQGAASTNINNAEKGEFNPFNFGTKVLNILGFNPKKLIKNAKYKKRQVRLFQNMISVYPEYLHIFSLNAIKAKRRKNEKNELVEPFPFTKENNLKLIEFQKECNFELITVFFKAREYNIGDYKAYRRKVGNKEFVAVLDMDMKTDDFKELYNKSLSNHDEVIGFFGRNYNKKNPNNINNFRFLARKRNSKILRIVLCAEKKKSQKVTSLSHYIYGMDVCVFRTHKGNQNIQTNKMEALKEFKFEELKPNTKLVCYITGKNLHESSAYFAEEFDGSSIPITTHTIVSLNETFKILHKKHTYKSLKKILSQ